MTDTPRTRARIETTEQIKAIARRQLASDGPDLSLRAVARELGVVSSAVYRYFASRDELLTALILDGYNSMGEAVEKAESMVPRRDLVGRWSAVWRATREWSRQRPAEYALLYGSPIPGYAAPMDTVVAAQRTLVVAVAVLGDGVDRGVITPPPDRLRKPVRADIETVVAYPSFVDLPAPLMARGMSMWALLFGTISFELFGRYNNAVANLDDYFEHQITMSVRYLGLT